jgi:hypothetical protein
MPSTISSGRAGEPRSPSWSPALRGEPDDVGVVLPYEEVIEALGLVSERSVGLQVVPLDQIVGSVGRGRDFDRRFRPTSGRSRGRWEQIAAAARRGEPFPPVDLVQMGELCFVRDGHHRVSVARALGRTDIDAYVTSVVTRVDPDRAIKASDLPLKSHERVFFERVPVPDEARSEIALSDAWDYDVLAEAVEAWGFRTMQSRGEALGRTQTALEWLQTEYRPVVAMLREAGLITNCTEADAYLGVADERWRLLRTHDWTDQVLQRVIEGRARRRPPCA